MSRDLSWVEPGVFERRPFREFGMLLPELAFSDWRSPEVRAANVAAMQTKSSLCSEVVRNKGGWQFPEKLYTGDPNYITSAPNQCEAVDRYIMRQPMCQSLAARFAFISGHLLPAYVGRCLKSRPTVRIASFGSGTGRDVMHAMRWFGDEVKGDLYDLDRSAFSVGAAIARQFGLQNRVRFIQADLAALTLTRPTYDIGLMIGIVCPLSDRLARRVIRAVTRTLKPGGLLVVSSSSERMEAGDVLCRFLIEYTAGWFLEFRDDRRMRGLLPRTMEIVESTAEPSGFNRLAVGRISSKATATREHQQ